MNCCLSIFLGTFEKAARNRARYALSSAPNNKSAKRINDLPRIEVSVLHSFTKSLQKSGNTWSELFFSMFHEYRLFLSENQLRIRIRLPKISNRPLKISEKKGVISRPFSPWLTEVYRCVQYPWPNQHMHESTDIMLLEHGDRTQNHTQLIKVHRGSGHPNPFVYVLNNVSTQP